MENVLNCRISCINFCVVKRKIIFYISLIGYNNVEQNLSGIEMRDLWLSGGFGFTNDYVKHAIKLRQKDVYFQEYTEYTYHR